MRTRAQKVACQFCPRAAVCLVGAKGEEREEEDLYQKLLEQLHVPGFVTYSCFNEMASLDDATTQFSVPFGKLPKDYLIALLIDYNKSTEETWTAARARYDAAERQYSNIVKLLDSLREWVNEP